MGKKEFVRRISLTEKTAEKLEKLVDEYKELEKMTHPDDHRENPMRLKNGQFDREEMLRLAIEKKIEHMKGEA